MSAPRFTRSIIAAAIALCSMPVLAAGVVEGRVSDATGSAYFEGAVVKLVGTSHSVTTTEDGRFRLDDIAAGEYTLTVKYIGADTYTQQVTVDDNGVATINAKIGEDVAEIENVLVYGQAAGNLRALNKMRAADNVVSVVSADSIGQFPDENVSEALQRVVGVFIERDQGEGRFVGIRGIDPRLNSATIGGVNVPSPEGDRRNVALDVIPSDLLESLEVFKTLTPDMDADSIGGTINIKSLSAFDRDGMTYSITGQGYYNELAETYGQKYAVTFTNVFELGGGELGVAVSASTNEREFGTDNIETDGTFDDGVAEEMELRDYQITRERDGLAVNLDYRLNDNHSYYFRTLKSKFSDQEFRNRIEFKLDEDDEPTVNGATVAYRDIEVQRELKDRYEEQEINSYVLGGKNIFNKWTLEYSASMADAQEIEPGRIDSEFEAGDIDFARYSLTNGRPHFSYSADALNADEFKLKEFALENNSSKDEETALRFDITRDMNFGGNEGYIKFGAKLREREKQNDTDVAIYEPTDDVFLTEFIGAELDYDFVQYGPEIDSQLQRQYVAQNIAAGGLLALDSQDAVRDFNVQEDVNAYYVMSRVDIDSLRVVYGVRYEETDLLLRGVSVIEGDVKDARDVRVQRSYENLLPSINLRYEASEALIARAAYYESISRPSFGDLSPTPDEVEIDDGELNVETGNTALNPYEAQNVDLGFDYYSDDIGAFNAGMFYKNIDNFIFDAEIAGVVSEEQVQLLIGSTPISEVNNFSQPQNGNSAELYGLELGWSQNYDSGLVLMANATFTDSEADLGLGEDADRSSKTTLPSQADTVANFVVGYENEGWSLRLSTAYLSERLVEVDLEDTANDLYEDERTQVDLSVKYNVNNSVQVYFNAINLNEAPNHRYLGSRRFNAQYDEIGRSYTVGMTIRNF